MCAGKILNYCSLLHFNEVKYFSQDGRGLPNGIGFQRGNFIKECAENVEVNENHRTACWMYIKNALEAAEGKEEKTDE